MEHSSTKVLAAGIERLTFEKLAPVIRRDAVKIEWVATPEAGAVCCEDESGEDGQGDSGEGGAEDSRITVGDPELNHLRIIEAGGDELVLELETGGFYADPQEDGTVRIWVPGYALTEDAGHPSLPVRRAWVEALAGRKVRLVSVESLEEEWYESLKPWYAGEPVVEMTRRGTVRAARKRVRRREARQSGLYPKEGARILSVGYQGDVKKAHVGVIPGIQEYLVEFTSEKAWGSDSYLSEKGMIPMPDEERQQYRSAIESLKILTAVK